MKYIAVTIHDNDPIYRYTTISCNVFAMDSVGGDDLWTI